ncbi:zinc-binding dehydrogenase [Nocardia beijingensis]|uniref:quinone oxidoreductase family protein n=1 Tax=Nocardia beijingensis TaxID=95162 RepID=UPI001894818B|nr:zinc-binding dehydrogenase [Nocardia beijingensis]MBF6079375.1 zinc-binding dehydrogenase [Nocardia beijingensis]
MRAVRYHEYGDPEVLRVEEVDDPAPGEGELLVRATATGVNYFEVQVRAGAVPDPLGLSLPHTPGIEVAGTVTAVGPGVDTRRIGERVIGTVASGSYAELVRVPAAAAVPLDERLGEHQALALLGQGATAVGVFETAGIGPEDTVLVEAAGGGIGTLLVQLAKRAGARVVAGASGAAKRRLAADLGADATVDYTRPGWTEEAGPVSVVLETVGGRTAREAYGLLTKPGARMVVFGSASGVPVEIGSQQLLPVGASLIPFSLGYRPQRWPELARRAEELTVRGEITPVIGTVLPLAEAAAAHRAFENRTAIGKTILTV